MENNNKIELYVITGPCGVGKSTITNMIAKNLESSAIIEGDDIYHMVIGGYVSPWKDHDKKYTDLFWDNCLDLIDNFINKDISVVFNYIIYPDRLKQIIDKFKDNKNLIIKFVVLTTDEKTIRERDKLRPEDCQMGDRAIVVLNEFKEKGYDNKYILDTSNISPEDTTKLILNEDSFILYK